MKTNDSVAPVQTGMWRARLAGQHSLQLVWLAASGALALACQSENVRDLGSTQAELSDVVQDEPLTPQDFTGVWLATARDALVIDGSGQSAPLPFPSGSSLVTLNIHGDGVFPDRLASLTFGEGEPPVPAEDPTQLPAGIPPEWNDSDPFNTPPLEGFPYALSQTSLLEELGGVLGTFNVDMNRYPLVDGILRLGFSADQIFHSFCVGLPRGVEAPACECQQRLCLPHPDNPLDLYLRHTATGLSGIVVGGLRVPNQRGGITALGELKFTRAD